MFASHLRDCLNADAAFICDRGVNGDDVIATMLATGLWRLSDDVEYIAGQRIRMLVPIGDDAMSEGTEGV